MEDWQAAKLEFFRHAKQQSHEIAKIVSARFVGILAQRVSALNSADAKSAEELVKAASSATGSPESATADCPRQQFNTHVVAIFTRSHRVSSLLEIENVDASYPGFLLGATILMITEAAQNTEVAKDLTWRLELGSRFLARLDDIFDTLPLCCSFTWVLLPVLIDVIRLWGLIVKYCQGALSSSDTMLTRSTTLWTTGHWQ